MKVNDILLKMQAFDLVRLHEDNHNWIVTACDLYASDSDYKEKLIDKIEADNEGVINLYLK